MLENALEDRLNKAFVSYDLVEAVAAIRAAVLAHGVTRVSRETGYNRVNLYKTLSSQANPKLDTVLRICSLLNIRIEVTRAHHTIEE